MNKFKQYFLSIQEKGEFEGIKFEDLNDEQSQELHALYLSNLDDQLKDAKNRADKSETVSQELKDELNAISEEVAKTNAEYSALNLKLAKAFTKSLIDKVESNDFNKDGALKEAFELCKTLHKGITDAMKEGKDFSFEIKTRDLNKVVDAIKADTLTTSVVNSTRGVVDPVITRLAHRRLTAYDSIISKPIIPINGGGTYRYTDQDSGTSVRAAAQVAEGAASPESTIAWEEKFIKLKKTSDHLPYSDEFAYDYANLMVELIDFLTSNVEIEVDDQIINGDGTGQNYNGMLASIPAFTPVASGITDANIFDLVVKVSQDITDTEGSKYQPNVVYMNSADIDSINFELKKDADNNYIPIRERLERRGFVIIENNSLAANVMIVGDNRYAHIPQDGMIRIKNDLMSGTDAIDGIKRVLVETRKNLLIKELEQTGWREVTSISAALTTLAT